MLYNSMRLIRTTSASKNPERLESIARFK